MVDSIGKDDIGLAHASDGVAVVGGGDEQSEVATCFLVGCNTSTLLFHLDHHHHHHHHLEKMAGEQAWMASADE